MYEAIIWPLAFFSTNPSYQIRYIKLTISTAQMAKVVKRMVSMVKSVKYILSTPSTQFQYFGWTMNATMPPRDRKPAEIFTQLAAGFFLDRNEKNTRAMLPIHTYIIFLVEASVLTPRRVNFSMLMSKQQSNKIARILKIGMIIAAVEESGHI